VSATARLLLLARPHAALLVLATLLAFGALGAGIGLMALSAYLISKAALVSGFTAVALIVTGVRALAMSRAVLRYCERYITHLVTFRILTTLRVWFYTSIEPLAPARLQDRRSGDLLARITADIDGLDQFYVRGLVTPAAGLLAIVLGVAILAVFDARVALLALAALLLAGAVLPVLHLASSRRAAVREAESRGGLTEALTGAVQGLPDALAFGSEGSLQAEVERLDRQLLVEQRRLGLRRAAFNVPTALLAAGTATLALALGVRQVEAGSLDGVYLALLPLTVIAGFEAAQLLASAVERMNDGVAAGRRLTDLVDTPAPQDAPVSAWAPAACSIEFDDVTFAYDEAARVLDRVSFLVPAGGRLYVTGPSGAGKSTLIALLLRFWEPQSGRIRVGGRDTRDLPVEELRALFAVVPQQPYLFNTTLRDNLLLARGEATDEELTDAAGRARLGTVIEALPDGLDSRIGENGLKLSGGERQRLAIARALLKDAPVLLLDEPSANLDAATGAQVWQTLEAEMEGRTTLIITHDRSRIPAGAAVLELPDLSG
jgi:ATP-binding cassette subfamily C protein CydC